MDYYEELGVKPNASEAEIRQMYRRTVKLFHPDQYQDPQMKAIAGRQMIRLNDILQTLTVPERRQRYDLSLLQVLRPMPRLQKSGVRERMSTRIEWNMQRLDHALRFTRKPLAATIFVACILGIIGGVALANMRDRQELPPSEPAATMQTDVDSPAAPANTAVQNPSLPSPNTPAPVSKPHPHRHHVMNPNGRVQPLPFHYMQSTGSPAVDQAPSY